MRLETRRLILQDYEESDKTSYFKLKSDPKTMYYLQDIQLFSQEESDIEFANVLQDQKSTDRKFYFLHMELKDSHEQIGSVGYTVNDNTPVGKLVEIILHRSPEKVKVVAQHTYPGSNPQMHGARLDVYLEESAAPGVNVSWSYDIEPEKDNKHTAVRSLPKRVRFYHAKIDAKGLKAGDNYHKLKNVAVIMIMPFDPFGMDRMVYTIRNICVEEPGMPYDDGAFTVFLYTKGNRKFHL